jgi:hypothetical protein
VDLSERIRRREERKIRKMKKNDRIKSKYIVSVYENDIIKMHWNLLNARGVGQ